MLPHHDVLVDAFQFVDFADARPLLLPVGNAAFAQALLERLRPQRKLLREKLIELKNEHRYFESRHADTTGELFMHMTTCESDLRGRTMFGEDRRQVLDKYIAINVTLNEELYRFEKRLDGIDEQLAKIKKLLAGNLVYI